MTQQPFVKICGLSTSESVTCAVQAGADAVGFVFAEGSPRHVSATQAKALISHVPEGVETVGVFRSQPIDEVIATAKSAGVSTIQFHGYEPYADLQRAKAEGFSVMRAFGIDEYSALNEHDRELWDAERLLIDAVEPGGGVPFDPADLTERTPMGWWLLAGGLTAENVSGLQEQLSPAGVDVSSGVEHSRGVKSLDRIETFLRAAKPSVECKRED